MYLTHIFVVKFQNVAVYALKLVTMMPGEEVMFAVPLNMSSECLKTLLSYFFPEDI